MATIMVLACWIAFLFVIFSKYGGDFLYSYFWPIFIAAMFWRLVGYIERRLDE